MTLLERFWAKVHVAGPDECWNWHTGREYGRFRIQRGFRDYRLIGAHVFSWILANAQDVPPGLFVLHACDNKLCVNPAHLSLGTVSDNAKQAYQRGRLDMEKVWAARRREVA